MNSTPHHPSQAHRPGCREFDLKLAAYLDGEERPEVTRHAAECPYCQVVLADLERITAVGRELPLADPPARLWANIRATLAEEGIIHDRYSFWQRWFPIPRLAPEARPVGALLVLAAMALVLIASIQSFETTSPSDKMLRSGPVLAAGFVPPGVSPALAETVREMEGAFRAEEDSFEPEMKATYEKSLETLDSTIQESLGQCQRNPGDLLARQYLLNAYQSKAEVLASALGISR